MERINQLYLELPVTSKYAPSSGVLSYDWKGLEHIFLSPGDPGSSALAAQAHPTTHSVSQSRFWATLVPGFMGQSRS